MSRLTVVSGIPNLVATSLGSLPWGYVYSVPYGTRLLDSLFGGQAFRNLWLGKGKPDEDELPKRLVEVFGIYMLFCFLRAAHPSNKNIRSYEDRIELLRSMIPLKYGMYYKFVELLRYGGKPFPAVSGPDSATFVFENKDKDTLDLSEKIITKWSQRLKEEYPELYDCLESSAEMAKGIVK